MYGFLHLIRLRTIAFAVLTMYAMRYMVIQPMLELNGFSLQMTNRAFCLLVIAVCCLISGAYVINDYFDTKSDCISGVKKVVVGKTISRRMAITMHTGLNILAIGISFFLGFACGVWEIGILFLLVSGILWFYSGCYKKYFILGNMLAGFMAALIPVSALIYEIPLLNMAYAAVLLETDTNFLYMFTWVFAFSWFLFLNILMYEINKDIYTVEGDRENGIRTIPVKLGICTARRIIVTLALLAIVTVVILYCLEFTASPAILVYVLAAIVLPYTIYMLVIQGNRRGVQLCLIRAIMVLCIGVSVFFRHFFQIIFVE